MSEVSLGVPQSVDTHPARGEELRPVGSKRLSEISRQITALQKEVDAIEKMGKASKKGAQLQKRWSVTIGKTR